MKIVLKQIPAPEFAFVESRSGVPAEEYEHRLTALYQAAQADWVAVYADREHYANLVYLLNFDPRFEEALLLLGPGGRRVLVLGNEDMGYTSVLPFPVDLVLCQTFSLGGQPRQTAADLESGAGRAGAAGGADRQRCGLEISGIGGERRSHRSSLRPGLLRRRAARPGIARRQGDRWHRPADAPRAWPASAQLRCADRRLRVGRAAMPRRQSSACCGRRVPG